MKYCFPLSFCPIVRLLNVGNTDSSFVIFLFLNLLHTSLLLLFQALISAVFYSFMSYSLVPFEQRGERYRNKKAIIKPLNTDYFLQKFDF